MQTQLLDVPEDLAQAVELFLLNPAVPEDHRLIVAAAVDGVTPPVAKARAVFAALQDESEHLTGVSLFLFASSAAVLAAYALSAEGAQAREMAVPLARRLIREQRAAIGLSETSLLPTTEPSP
jgi:hypothetical protein